MAQYRLIVCFDIEADGLQEAYTHLSEKVNSLGIAWETSDEWYDESSEEAGDPTDLTRAITAAFIENERKEDHESSDVVQDT